MKRLPTKKEAQELIDKCDWIWTDLDAEVKGWKVCSRVRNAFIFIPASGYKDTDGKIEDRYKSLQLLVNSENEFYESYIICREGGRPVIVDGVMNGRSTVRLVNLKKSPSSVDLGLSINWDMTNIGTDYVYRDGEYMYLSEYFTRMEFSKDEQVKQTSLDFMRPTVDENESKQDN